MRVVARTVLPHHGDEPTLALYATGTAFVMSGRESVDISVGGSVSFGSYFNAFPAAHWQHSTGLDTVDLVIVTTGTGSISVMRSDAAGVARRVAHMRVDGRAKRTVISLPLTGFKAGGWYWFEVSADSDLLSMSHAHWAVDLGGRVQRRACIAITTLDRPEYCTSVLSALAQDPYVLDLVDRVFVVDQGDSRLTTHPSFGEVKNALGEKLEVIEQHNLGGSGGFSRGMTEALARRGADQVVLLDDDVRVEPEALLRLTQFSHATERATIVGGHMLDLNRPTVLHSVGEIVEQRTFNWLPADPHGARLDVSGIGFFEPALHRRLDVDFNGWWMCAVPTKVLDRVGLALPFFIKWDDAEYGLRAKEEGIDTVSLPGAAVWHVDWTDKDDSRDWQSYFHSRNRLIAALLHSPFRRGAMLPMMSFALDLKHLLMMHYYAVALRQRAVEDVLRGPEMLTPTLKAGPGPLRELATSFAEAESVSEVAIVWPGPDDSLPARGRPSALQMPFWLVSNVTRHLFRRPRGTASVKGLTREQSRQWWMVPGYDSIAVPLPDSDDVAVFRRDRRAFRKALARSVALHARLYLNWRRLRRAYKSQALELASVPTWREQFGLATKDLDPEFLR